MRSIIYFEKEYSVHEFIKLNVIANRGTQNNIDKNEMLQYCEADGIEITGKESKEELFEIMCENGYTDEKWEMIAGVGVSSLDIQKEFNISHQDVKRLEKFGVLKVVGSYRTRAYGKYIYPPLYSVIQFAETTQEQMNDWLRQYPKGTRMKKLTN